ncbi:MAG: hypothetical protein KME59_21350 [Trichormus sp. ATA11-4-KO1]|jgi:hypothetical protein|nr:hypothetical protein [Trichormus sp. ATA11-4-KO1]
MSKEPDLLVSDTTVIVTVQESADTQVIYEAPANEYADFLEANNQADQARNRK